MRNSRQEVEKLLQEKNKQQAYEIVRKNYAADLIHFRLTDFIGPAFKDLRKFLFRLGNNYNSEDFKKYFLNNRYKDEDIDTFSKLYVDAVEKALMR